MKRRLVISALISVIVVVSMSIGAFAASNEYIQVLLNKEVKINLNGEAWQPKDQSGDNIYPLTYEGTTYLPVRAVGEAVGVQVGYVAGTNTVLLGSAYDEILYFPANEYPETAAHIASAILAGELATCTIDRDGADDNRDKSLAGIPTKEGYDRDEWPMAMCAEGGEGASVAYLDPSDNRGAGSWVGNQLEDYPDGTRVKFVISFEEMDADATLDTKTEQVPTSTTETPVLNAGCDNPTIKGNISSSGDMIFHSPGGAFYDRTDAEQMFCTTQEAEYAGFRASSR